MNTLGLRIDSKTKKLLRLVAASKSLSISALVNDYILQGLKNENLEEAKKILETK